MCGILCYSLLCSGHDTNFIHELSRLNAARGPDAQQWHDATIMGNGRESHLLLSCFGSELQLRGKPEPKIVQPHHRDGDLLLWNGEIFNGLDITSEDNDGEKLFVALRACRSANDIAVLLSTIEGPYALAFLQHSSKRLYFSRDPLGRRSLLLHHPTAERPYFILSSVSAGNDYYDLVEIDCSVLYCLDLSKLVDNMNGEERVENLFRTSLETISRLPTACNVTAGPYASISAVNRSVPPGDWPIVQSLAVIPSYLQRVVDQMIEELDDSVKRMVRSVPKPQIGSDSSARLAILFSGGIDCTVLAALSHRHVPANQAIDLLNVAFENPRKLGFRKESKLPGKRMRKREHEALIVEEPCDYMVPDRVSGLEELNELRAVYPERKWNFVEVNVPYDASQEARGMVERLMLPSKTVMDLSLAMALYFASGGEGQVRPLEEAEPISYKSNARVLLNGLGSDELLGGYARHRTAFSSGGWEAVIEELQLELDRISFRNLGRDDRIISSHGKEVRHPFLCLDFIRFVAGLPVHMKMDPRIALGLGDKQLLRFAAYKLGLPIAAQRRKRAMQFGSHAARMDEKQLHGTNVLNGS